MLVIQNAAATPTTQGQLTTTIKAIQHQHTKPSLHHANRAAQMMRHYPFEHRLPDQAQNALLPCPWLHLLALLRQVQLLLVLERPELRQLDHVARQHLAVTLLRVAGEDSGATLRLVAEEGYEEASMLASAEAEVCS